MNKMLMQFWDRERGKAVTVSTDNPMPGAGGSQAGGDALPEHVLDDRTFTNDDGQQTGSMPDQSGKLHTQTSWHNDDGNTSLAIEVPKGFYPGNEENLRIQLPTLLPDNIKKDVSIGGVTGTYEPFSPIKTTVQTNAESFGENDNVYVLTFNSTTASGLKSNLLGIAVKFMDDAAVWDTIDLSSMTFYAFKVGEIIGEQQVKLGNEYLSIHFGDVEANGNNVVFDLVFSPSGGTFIINENNPLMSVDVWTY